MKRAYAMSARAESAQETGERILDAAFAHFRVEPYDDVTLDRVAADAEVSVQTVIRRFGSKDGIVRSLTETHRASVNAQRGEAPVGDLPKAVANLLDHYESEGDLMMHLLRQENRVQPFAEITAAGRRFHADWCARVFAPYLDARTGIARHRLNAQLIAVCDLSMWHLLRRQQGLSRRQTHLALLELLEGAVS